MAAHRFMIVAALALALASVANAAPAGAAMRAGPHARTNHPAASEVSAQRVRHLPRPRIEIFPRPRLLYRQCTGGYELQYRPSGTVLFPYRYCWWVRG